MLFLIAAAMPVTAARSGMITFNEIADTSSGLSGFQDPAINDNGAVALGADFSDGGNDFEGVFRASGGSVTEIERASTFSIASPVRDLRFSDDGTVVFRLRTSSTNTEGDLVASDGTTRTVLGTNKQHELGSINASGVLASNEGGLSNENVLARPINGDPLDLIARTIAGNGGLSHADINDAGTVIFSAVGDVEINGTEYNIQDDFPGTGVTLFSTDGTSVTTTAYRSQTISPGVTIDSLRGQSINSDGAIAFTARIDEDGFGEMAEAILFGDTSGSTPTILVNGRRAGFDFFHSPPNLNNNGTLAFLAALDTGGQGIFTGADPVADKVIAAGDPLFGSTVQSLGFDRGLNDQDELAFRYTLENGTSGIAVAQLNTTPTSASPVPEPSSLALMGFGLAGLSGYGWRRRRTRNREARS